MTTITTLEMMIKLRELTRTLTEFRDEIHRERIIVTRYKRTPGVM